MRRPLVLALTAAVLAGCADRAAEPVRVVGMFLPVDDGAADAGFAAFRDSLRAVVARRDTAALVATVADGARLSFGDDAGGPDGFRAKWFAATPPEGESAWAALGRILDGGSTVQDGAVTVPYSFEAWPDSIDAGSHVAITGEDVEARVAPSDTAAVAALVSHAILPAPESAVDGFQRVRLPGGTEAFVAAAATTSPFDYRASFWDDGDGWQMHFFIAGD